MTVKELIVKLLDFPMDTDIELETVTDENHLYSTGNATDVEILRRVNGHTTVLIESEGCE